MVSASMLGYGSLAKANGVPAAVAIASAPAIWGLPGQVAMVEMVIVGAPLLAIIVASSMANLRFLPMALAFMPIFRKDEGSWRWRYGLVHLMSVNTWASTLKRAPTIAPEHAAPYYCGFSAVCLTGGTLGTAAGFVLAGTLPFAVKATLVFLNPVYFAFVFAQVRHRNALLAMILGAFLGPLLHPISPSWSLPVAGLLAGTGGWLLDKVVPGRRLL